MNRFMTQDASSLVAACNRLASALDHRGSASPESRAALAQELKEVLLACALRLTGGRHTPNTPEQRVQGGGWMLAAAYEAWYQHECATLRLHGLLRAADLVHGARGYEWSTRRPGSDPTPSEMAVESDAGLRQALQLLEAQVKR